MLDMVFLRTFVRNHSGGRLAQWLASQNMDQGVPGSIPGRAQFVVALSKSHLPTA